MNFKTNLGKNYAAKLIKVDAVTPVPKSDRISTIVVDHQTVVVGRDTAVGELRIFFPAESQIAHTILHGMNEYRIGSDGVNLNSDQTGEDVGYFDKNRRVKAVKMRGVRSSGYSLPAIEVFNILGVPPAEMENLSEHVGTYFDTIVVNGADVEICVPYVAPNDREKQTEGKQKQPTSLNRLVQGQHYFHADTPKLRRNMSELALDDEIEIHSKFHGTSFNVANVLVKRNLSVLEKIARWLGVGVNEFEYDALAGSRRTIKNKYLEDPKNSGGTAWHGNLYMDVTNEIKDRVPHGYTVYGEVVGYDTNGGFIQPDFDYGCRKGERKILIYRITMVNDQGVLFEMSNAEIRDFCAKYAFEMTPFLYGGTVRHWMEQNVTGWDDRNWQEKFIEKMTEIYNGNFEPTNLVKKVPAEGVIVRKCIPNQWKVYKFKDATFCERYS